MLLTTLHAQPPFAGRLVALRISNGARDQKDLPTRLKLLNWGVNQTVKGPVTVGKESAKSLAVNQAKQGYDRVAIDFNHQTVPGSEEYQKIIKLRGSIDPLPVAGYGTPVVIPGDGLYLENIEWTPSGQENARNYHDLSPTPLLNKQGEVVFLHSVALCRQGAVDGLTFFNASLLHLTTMDNDTTTTPPPSNSGVDYKGLLISILQKLGVAVPDGASDADIAGMVDQFKAPAPTPPTTKKDGPASPEAPDPTTMTPGERFIFSQLQKLQADRDGDAKHTLILRASQEGKVIPLGAEEIKATPLSVLQVMVDKLPPGTVPTQSHRGNGAAPAGGTPPLTTLTAGEKEMCLNLGITEESFLKEKQKNPGAARVTPL
jgi:phage I-like protein